MGYELRCLDASTLEEFHAFFERPSNYQGCHCMYWEYSGSNEEWGKVEPEDLKARKRDLVQKNGSTGYLLYEDRKVVAWCQVGHRSYFEKLNRISPYAKSAHDDVTSITCFAVDPSYRKRGVARRLLEMVLEDLEGKGVKIVEGYPRPGSGLPDGDVWMGPLSLFLSTGFTIHIDDSNNPVVRKVVGGLEKSDSVSSSPELDSGL